MNGLDAHNILRGALGEAKGELSLASCAIESRARSEQLPQLLADRPGPILLDSSSTHEQFGRWTLAAFDPIQTVRLVDGLLCTADGIVLADNREAIWRRLSEMFATRCQPLASCPYGPGWFGYLGYELGRQIETLPATTENDTHMPDLHLGLYDVVAAYDTLAKRWQLVYLTGLDNQQATDHRVNQWKQVLTSCPAWPQGPETDASSASPAVKAATFRPNFTPCQYRQAVGKCIDFIAAGDIFQVNLSQRLAVDNPPHDVAICRQLRRRNPAWYGGWMRIDTPAGPRALCSISPELFLRVRGRSVLTRPIKGTRPRCGDETIDTRMAGELVESPKDNAELAMIIDLLRNDLGRVCRFGSVQVRQARQLETHPTVFHLVGTVVGELQPQADHAQLLQATFPGGSITGAPKIRAMEIIDEIEPVSRGPYTGCIGGVCLNGSAEWNIAIRTIVWSPETAWVQVGGGIVADSDPQGELDETLDKARAMLEAIGLAYQEDRT